MALDALIFIVHKQSLIKCHKQTFLGQLLAEHQTGK